MEIREVEERSPLLIGRLLAVWESSVKATHLFLSSEEILKIKQVVPQALYGVGHLVVAEEEGRPAGLMGVTGHQLELLFLAPEQRGKGLGRRLLTYGMEHFGVNRLTVNEQNPLARGFYEHMGFRVCRRTETDEQGGPYPILYMELEENSDGGKGVPSRGNQ